VLHWTIESRPELEHGCHILSEIKLRRERSFRSFRICFSLSTDQREKSEWSLDREHERCNQLLINSEVSKPNWPGTSNNLSNYTNLSIYESLKEWPLTGPIHHTDLTHPYAFFQLPKEKSFYLRKSLMRLSALTTLNRIRKARVKSSSDHCEYK
jgi:hypothetical protein